MNGYIGVGVALAVAAGAATWVSAEDLKKVGEAAGWEIAVNKNMGPGCLILKRGDGMQVELGINALNAEKIGYMAVFTRADIGAAEGDMAPVQFEVGGKTYDGEAFGEKMNGFQGAWVPVHNPDFVYELAKMETMKITVEGIDPIDVSLAGTDDAFKALRECQEAQ